jgi:acetylornithine deacetylase
MRCSRLGWQPAARVILQSVIEEECTGNGALACLLEGYTADAALIPEPMDELMSAQMGVMWMTLDVYGVPVHAAVAHTGIGAIDFAQLLVQKLRELEAQWNEPSTGIACTASTITRSTSTSAASRAASGASSVSTFCRVDLRLGFYPGVKPAEVRAEVEALLREPACGAPGARSVQVEISYHGFQAEGWWSTCSSRRCAR